MNRHKSYQYKPWLNEDDSKNVFFASIHGYGKLTPTGIDYFYPGSGHSPNKVDYVKNEVSGVEFTVCFSFAVPMIRNLILSIHLLANNKLVHHISGERISV